MMFDVCTKYSDLFHTELALMCKAVTKDDYDNIKNDWLSDNVSIFKRIYDLRSLFLRRLHSGKSRPHGLSAARAEAH